MDQQNNPIQPSNIPNYPTASPAPTPVTPPSFGSTAFTPPHHRKVGPIITIFVVILIIVIAIISIFASRINKQDTVPAIQTNTVENTGNNVDQSASATISVQPITNNSDDVQSLQNDLNVSTNGVDEQNF